MYCSLTRTWTRTWTPLFCRRGYATITRLVRPSAHDLELYLGNRTEPGTPALLEGVLSSWRAIEEWKDIDNLRRAITPNGKDAAASVPIEISIGGAGYNQPRKENTSDRLHTILDMPFVDFVNNVFSDEKRDIPPNMSYYLAQYDLIEKMPHLVDYFGGQDQFPRTKQATNLSTTRNKETSTTKSILQSYIGLGHLYSTRMWLGHEGTITPIHCDPYHNLFCGVNGTKTILLLPPHLKEELFIYSVPETMRNTSQIPAYLTFSDENATEEGRRQYPRFFSEQVRTEGILTEVQPGQVVIIPKGWWHAVRADTRAVSVNFWFL